MRTQKVHISAPLLSHALDSIIPKLATCQYFTRDKYVSLASFTGNSFFQKMWLSNFQLANSQTYTSQTCNSDLLTRSADITKTPYKPVLI